MPLFRLRRAKTATLPPGPVTGVPVIDRTVGDPDAARLRDAMTARDWAAARAVLDGRDADDLSFLIGVASGVTGTEEWLPDVVRADLRDTTAQLLYGARVVRWAWEARTGLRAKHVTQDQFAVFHERLRLAEDCLQDVVRREPANAAAWQEMLAVSRGLQLGLDETRRRFDEVVRHCPGHLRAHRQLLQQLCLKWGGSHKLMHDFAREASAAAAPGSPLGVLIVEAYLEEWLDEGRKDDLFPRPKTRRELRAAADRSVLHPEYRQRPGWPVVHNTFAMAFSLSGDLNLAAEQFGIIGDLVTDAPWQYLNSEPAKPFAARRKTALAAAR